MKRVFAVIILIIGNFLLYSAFFLLGGKIRINTEDLVLSIIFIAIGGGIVLGGTALWGWIRKKIVLGVSLTTVGTVLSLMSISSRKMYESHPSFPAMAFTRLLIFGLILIALGIFLIVKQKKLDKSKNNSSLSASVSTNQNTEKGERK